MIVANQCAIHGILIISQGKFTVWEVFGWRSCVNLAISFKKRHMVPIGLSLKIKTKAHIAFVKISIIKNRVTTNSLNI